MRDAGSSTTAANIQLGSLSAEPPPHPASRVASAFARANGEGRAALIPFVTVGWPELGDTERIVPALIDGGADIIELGIPFSDPIAEGPTIQRTSQRALGNGVTPAYALEVARRLREQGVEAPLFFMGYYNPVFSYGLPEFAAACAGAGIDGLLVPDLPPEESDALRDACLAHDLILIYFLAPTSTPERVAAVVERASGFIYLISLTGVTGARGELPDDLADYVARVRGRTTLPLAIGFGVSRREHVALAETLVDGVACGSALLDALAAASSADLPRVAKEFMATLRGGDA
jgi:tryptophan synthase alpha chain